jgi:hypothetical protein
MFVLNGILTELGIDTEEFFYSDNVKLYHKNDIKPFGEVIYKDGHYKLTVGNVVEPNGRKHVVR